MRDIGSNIILDGLRKLIISSPEEALHYIIQGSKLRHTASTLMNNQSSRSHAVISIYIEKTISTNKNNNAIGRPNLRAKIQKNVDHIIDLAWSCVVIGDIDDWILLFKLFKFILSLISDSFWILSILLLMELNQFLLRI